MASDGHVSPLGVSGASLLLKHVAAIFIDQVVSFNCNWFINWSSGVECIVTFNCVTLHKNLCNEAENVIKKPQVKKLMIYSKSAVKVYP